MSRGIGGYMNLIAADDTMLIYSYCCYNVNNDDWREMQKMEDGEIFIDRAALVPTNVDAELLAKVLSNPEMAALLSTLAKSLESK